MPFFEDLKSKLSYLDTSQIEQIYQAYLFAREAHEGQKRDSGEPYLIHPVAVAGILADMHLDSPSIIAAFLHDVVEDTHVNKDKIISQFGSVVAEIVDGVTKLSKMEFLSYAEVQAESFRKMVLAMSRDIRVIIVKLADRLHNMQTMGALSLERKKRIANETLDIYAPIASRLGMHELSVQLEELSFLVRYPWRYKILQNAMSKLHVTQQEIIDEIKSNITDVFVKHSITDAKIFQRDKHLYSIYRRMQRYHSSFKDATNNYIFRILMPSTDACYLALGLIHQLYKPILGKFEDFIAIPKFNGYQSLHTSLFGPLGIPLEMQIRTYAMDHMANYGVVTYWYELKDVPGMSALYDRNVAANIVAENPHTRAQKWIANLLEMQQSTSSSLEFVDNVKTDLFPDEIYVFTPRGKIVELPKGATAVDFAYIMHTDIGNACVAAKIDNQFAPLSTSLKSGQTISIITMPEAKPNPVWLNFVVSAKARSSISNFLKTQKHSESIALGKELLEKSLTDLGSSLSKVPIKVLKKFLKESGLKNIEELYQNIGLGNNVPIFIAHQLLNTNYLTEEHNTSKVETKPMLIKGANGMAISFATCCHPIPYDRIVGYLQAGQGLVVHRQDCMHAAKLKSKSEICMPVLWAEDVKGEFLVIVNVEVVNQRGVLAVLTHAVAAMEANIEDVHIQERSSGYSLVELLLRVKDVSHLERILRHISTIPTVIGVFRAMNLQTITAH